MAKENIHYKKLFTCTFIDKAIEKYGNVYRYDKTVYVNSQTKVIITCKIHGDFTKRADVFLSGQECIKCLAENKRLKYEKLFKEKSNKIHNFKYNYDNSVFVNCTIPTNIKCPKHGDFMQVPSYHYRGDGCPKCSEPEGELKLEIILKKLNLKYDSKVGWIKFSDCVNPLTKRKLRFDFLLYDDTGNILCIIEYDGPQHYMIDYGKYKFKTNFYEDILYRDCLKNEYCKSKNIQLIRIPYFKQDYIENILMKELNLKITSHP